MQQRCSDTTPSHRSRNADALLRPRPHASASPSAGLRSARSVDSEVTWCALFGLRRDRVPGDSGEDFRVEFRQRLFVGAIGVHDDEFAILCGPVHTTPRWGRGADSSNLGTVRRPHRRDVGPGIDPAHRGEVFEVATVRRHRMSTTATPFPKLDYEVRFPSSALRELVASPAMCVRRGPGRDQFADWVVTRGWLERLRGRPQRHRRGGACPTPRR